MNHSGSDQVSWIRGLFGGSRAGLRDAVAALATSAMSLVDPAERIAFLEAEIGRMFSARRVRILQRPEGPERFSPHSTQVRDVLSRVLGTLHGLNCPFLSEAVGRDVAVPALLRSVQATYVVPIGPLREATGAILLDTSPQSILDRRTEEMLAPAAAQIGIVLQNTSLLKAKLDLESAVARQAELAQLGEMAARIAHEIKNPLSSIKTIVQVMSEDVELTPKYGRDLELIHGEIDRLARSVGQLLGYARPAQDRRGEVTLRDVVTAVEKFLKRDLEHADVHFENRVPGDLPKSLGSEVRFREILLNLILNAVQAGGQGTRVSVSAASGVLADQNEAYVQLVVEDDGPGVPTELHSRVFAPFFTTRQKGTGLGLAIVKRNVEQLGGHIALESPVSEGRGTRFLIHFPVEPEDRGDT